MKTNIALIAVMALGAASASAQDSALSISTTVGWESKYVFRGIQLGEEIITPSIDLSYGGAYIGVWGAFPVDAQANNIDDDGYWNEVDIYAGYGFALGEMLSADMGVTYYSYPSVQEDLFGDPNTTEIYFGVAAETMASPAVYAYYDFDLENFTVEASIGHSLPLAESMSLDVGVYVGFVFIGKDENAIGYTEDDSTTAVDEFAEGEDTYTYYGATADLVYSVNENAALTVGVRWGGSGEDLIGDYNETDFDSSAFWFGGSISVGF